jgi:phosphoribosylformimino-5-aminoimidazole carboxamide ribotide isomerase
MLVRLGINRVILGTAACEDEGFLKNVVKEFGPKILVSIDARDGVVATKGWRDTTNLQVMDFIKRVKDLGVDEIIYTNIAKDGALAGPDIQGIKKILDFLNLENITSGIIASGGVSSLEDVQKLKGLEPLGLIGVIIGKALYEGKIDLKEAIKC